MINDSSRFTRERRWLGFRISSYWKEISFSISADNGLQIKFLWFSLAVFDLELTPKSYQELTKQNEENQAKKEDSGKDTQGSDSL